MQPIYKMFFLFGLLIFPQLSTFTKPCITFFTRAVGCIHGYEGHAGVVSSIKRGLKQLNIDFNFNPIDLKDIAENVVVLSSTDALRTCIQLKKNKKIKCILAGPNLMVMPFEGEGILADIEIDKVLVPSQEIERFYHFFNPNIRDNIYVWPSGVDTDFWRSCESTIKKNKVLIYWKTESESFLSQIELLVKRHGYDTAVIQYGNYTPNQYRSLLSEAKYAIFISRSESQGLALAEAWAAGVPTLVWNPQRWTNGAYSSELISAAPYLTKFTGVFWKTLEELDYALANITETLKDANPHLWAIQNMSDIISAQHLYDIVCNNH